MVVDLVVAAPQPLVGGHRQEQHASGCDRPADLAERAKVVLEVLDHVKADCEIEAVVGERHLEDGAFDHLAAAAFARLRDARPRQLDAGHGAAPRELDHVAPAAAAGVEDPCGSGQVEAVEHPLQHPSPAPVPPMTVLGLEGLLLVIAVHPSSIFS